MHRIILALILLAVFLMIWWFIVTTFIWRPTDPLPPQIADVLIPPSPPGENEQGISISYGHLQQSKGSPVKLRTVVNLFSTSNRLRKPVKNLTEKNFIVTEEHSSRKVKVNALEVKPLASPIRVILLIDASSSMEEMTNIRLEREKRYLSKIEVVQGATVSFVKNLSDVCEQLPPSYIAFLPFYGSGGGNLRFLENGHGGMWFPCSSASLPIIKEKINSIDARSSTPLLAAVDLVLRELSKLKEDEYKLVFCLTDGHDTASGSLTLEKLKSSLSKAGIPVVTLGYGRESQQQLNRLILQEISKSSGAGGEKIGFFVNIPFESLPEVLKVVALEISSAYEIIWESTAEEDGTLVKVDVKVRYKSHQGNMQAPKFTRRYKLLRNDF